MNSTTIFDDLIYYLKISLIDKNKDTKEDLESIKLKFSNIEEFDEEDILDSNIAIINLSDKPIDSDTINLCKNCEDTTFIVVSKNNLKDVKYTNVLSATSMRSLDNKILKTYKDRYKEGKLSINFSNNTNYNLKYRKLFDKDGSEVRLTQRELDLLELLINNMNSVTTHKTIQSKIWHESYEVSDSAYKSLLNKLRSKIGKNSIKSVSKKGYSINFE